MKLAVATNWGKAASQSKHNSIHATQNGNKNIINNSTFRPRLQIYFRLEKNKPKSAKRKTYKGHIRKMLQMRKQ